MNTGPQAIAEAFAKTRREGRAALLICLPAVGRNPEWVREAAVAAVAAGADMLEFQTRAPMPPSIALEYAPVISQSVDVPLLLWADAQTVVHFGADSPHPLADACQTAGISGIASPISGPAHFMWASGPSRDEVAPISFVTTGMDEMSFKMPPQSRLRLRCRRSRSSRAPARRPSAQPPGTARGNPPAHRSSGRTGIGHQHRRAGCLGSRGVRGSRRRCGRHCGDQCRRSVRQRPDCGDGRGGHERAGRVGRLGVAPSTHPPGRAAPRYPLAAGTRGTEGAACRGRRDGLGPARRRP
jgi:hypothetical protein